MANLDLDSPAHELTALLAALVPAVERRFAMVSAELGLSKPQAHLLAQLPTDRGLSQRETSQRLHCAPSSIVPLIDSLEQRGWLARQVDSADRRVNVLMLTPSGSEVRQRMMRQLLDPPAAIRRLSSEQQHQLRDLLRGVVRELGEP